VNRYKPVDVASPGSMTYHFIFRCLDYILIEQLAVCAVMLSYINGCTLFGLKSVIDILPLKIMSTAIHVAVMAHLITVILIYLLIWTQDLSVENVGFGSWGPTYSVSKNQLQKCFLLPDHKLF
jgi:hypothetical protein